MKILGLILFALLTFAGNLCSNEIEIFLGESGFLETKTFDDVTPDAESFEVVLKLHNNPAKPTEIIESGVSCSCAHLSEENKAMAGGSPYLGKFRISLRNKRNNLSIIYKFKNGTKGLVDLSINKKEEIKVISGLVNLTPEIPKTFTMLVIVPEKHQSPE